MRGWAALLLLLPSCGGTGAPVRPIDERKEREAAAAFQAGKQAYEAGDHDAAIARLTEAVNLSPEFPQAYLFRAKARAAKGESPEEDFERAIRAAGDEKKAIYLFHRARWHQDKSDWTRALADLEEACRLQKTLPLREYYFQTFLERGRTYAALGRPEDAIRDYDFLLGLTHDEAERRRLESLKIEAAGKKPR